MIHRAETRRWQILDVWTLLDAYRVLAPFSFKSFFIYLIVSERYPSHNKVILLLYVIIKSLISARAESQSSDSEI